MKMYTTYLIREVRKITTPNPSFPSGNLVDWEYTGNNRVIDNLPDWSTHYDNVELSDALYDYALAQFGNDCDGYEIIPLEKKSNLLGRKIIQTHKLALEV
jgi:hypothetical protein